MSKGSHLALILSAISTVAGADIYREDFDDDVTDLSKWADASDVTGTFNEKNKRLEYVVTTPSGATDEARRTFSIPVPYNKDWTVTLLTSFSIVPALGENIGIGIAFHHATDLNRRLYIQQFSEGASSGQFRGFQSKFGNVTSRRRSDNFRTMQAPAAVRLAYNSKSKIVFASFDIDGPANDLIWEVLNIYSITGSAGFPNQNWNLTEADPLRVSIEAFSNFMTIHPGDVSVDDFKLSILSEDQIPLDIRQIGEAVELSWPAAGACFNVWSGDIEGTAWNWDTGPIIEREDRLYFRWTAGFPQYWFRLGRLIP